MKAPAPAQARLLELQALDNRLAQLARLERELPERAARDAIAAERHAVRADLATTSGALEDVRLELRRTESDVAVVEARIARDSERMMMASASAKDAAAFEHEIASLRRRQSELEEIELAVMERVEEHETAVAAIRERLARLDAELGTAEAAVTAALKRIAGERAEAAASREAIVEALPADLVALYERQRARYGVGASLLRRGVSEASGLQLEAADLARVRAADPEEVLLCPQSSAILVRTAESGP